MLTGSITIFDRTQNRADQAQIDDAVTRSEFQRLVRLDADGLSIGDNRTPNSILIDSESVNVRIGGKTFTKMGANYQKIGEYKIRRTSDGGLAFGRD